MKNLTPEQVADKHASRLTAAIPDVIAGINAVTVNPMETAAAASGKWIASLMQAEAKWKRNIGKVTLEEWKRQTADKGAPRIAAGIQAARAKQVDFYSRLLPFEATLQAKVNAMADTTLQDSIAKVTAWMTGMQDFQN